MDLAEVEESLFAASDAKLHGEMCRLLSGVVCKVLGIFPVLEASRPRSKSGIQALCSLHIALEKAKGLLQHCSESSKLYLAITGDSVVLKFEKARGALADSLRRVEDIVPQAVSCQISEIVNELNETLFSLDPIEKQAGDEVIALLQLDRKNSGNDNNELETFHQAASRLGITSSRAALTERRALKKLSEKARMEEDKRKESIVEYLLHLMRKYSKLFRSEVSDDNDSQGSAPCSPTVQGFDESSGFGMNCHAFERQISKLSSFNFKTNNRRSGQVPVPPEELRCPISLQLMYDPVIISSGQTYERVCIEKWFSDGHSTCPKTQQQLDHLGLTPNYCVKGLVAGWCDHFGIPAPSGPPDSLDQNYCRRTLSECESTNSKSIESISSSKLQGAKVVPVEDGIVEETNENERVDVSGQNCDMDVFEKYESLLASLREEGDIRGQCKVVEQIRRLLKDDEAGRIFMGTNGLVEELVQFLSFSVHEGNGGAQEIGAMALFNLAVNNNRNKERMLTAGVIPLLEEMILNSSSHESACAVYLNLSCLEEAKPIIGSSPAVPFLVQLLQTESTSQCKLDAVHALYNLSTQLSNIPHLLSAGILEGLESILTMSTTTHSWVEKSIAVFINLASTHSGKEEMISSPGLVSKLSAVLDTGEPIEQEQAVACILMLCNGDARCSDMVLQEGVIPALVSISVNGTTRGKEKAQKLLMVFREQRQRDPSPVSSPPISPLSEQEGSDQRSLPAPDRRSLPAPDKRSLPAPDRRSLPSTESKPLCKSTSKRMGKSWGSLWKSKHLQVHQY